MIMTFSFHWDTEIELNPDEYLEGSDFEGIARKEAFMEFLEQVLDRDDGYPGPDNLVLEDVSYPGGC